MHHREQGIPLLTYPWVLILPRYELRPMASATLMGLVEGHSSQVDHSHSRLPTLRLTVIYHLRLTLWHWSTSKHWSAYRHLQAMMAASLPSDCTEGVGHCLTTGAEWAPLLSQD